MGRNQHSLQVPLRPSSAHSDMSNGDGFPSEHSAKRASKAHKILGTTEIPSQQQANAPRDDTSTKRRTRPSFMKSGGLVPFPSANSDGGSTSQHQQQQQQHQPLRVRASSPLLAPPGSQATAPPKKAHQSGSSTLFSYFNSRDSSEASAGDQHLKPQQSSLSLNSSKSSSKDSKRKLRPPRIDLSLLFPKPKPTAAPLLSPQRMTHSPSPLSAAAQEFPRSKPTNVETRPAGRRYTAAQPPAQKPSSSTLVVPGSPPAAIRRPSSHRSAPADRSSTISTDTRNTDWLEAPLQRTVRTSEMDLALQNYSEQQKSTERRPNTASSIYSRGREQQHSSRPKPSEESPHMMPSNASVGGWSKETYLSPKSRPAPPTHRRPSPSPDRWPEPSPSRQSNKPSDNVSSTSKRSGTSGKSTMANSDLNNSSVLCLSSSEDEDDDHDGEVTHGKTTGTNLMRESVTTYGEHEPEICTASAAQATKGPTVRRLDLRQQSNDGHRGPRTMLKSPSFRSSAGHSSLGRKASRRTSGIPTISEPDILSSDLFPQPGGGGSNGYSPLSPRESHELNRRSRIISVTRQEEDLLEAMRLRKGKVTPSLFNETRYNQNPPSSHPPLPHNPNHNNTTHATDTDRGSILSGPSRDSMYNAEMSFLRLSAASVPSYMPPTAAATQTDQGAAHMDKDSLPSQGAGSDAEQKTINSSVSPRASLVYSESLPSPSTSGASPMTPTLPIHRFSSLSSQRQPPNQPLPAVPSHDQRRHSRRRTDSSEAIVLGETAEDDPKDNDEFPIWALGWRSHNDQNIAAVH